MNTFRSGVADRGASIRIPLPVQVTLTCPCLSEMVLPLCMPCQALSAPCHMCSSSNLHFNLTITSMNRGEKRRSCQVPWCGLHPAVANYWLKQTGFCIAFLRSSELAPLVMCTCTEFCTAFMCSSRTTDTLRTGGQLPMSTLTRWHASLSRPPSPSEQHSAGSAAAASHP